ncbi:DUF3899 domain-containing protein [Mycoplasmopsis fermentans]|nr:DUF3899 domain-containing protein [Mycoplasmopsis fermentans]VEU67456.1 Uncharacterised protein [Mesomycoplasma conjunctivae]ADN68846.1 hypothetical membrane spanning protein [Mycoplasmopsis fermentans JER]ADV34290.1 Conserved Hypothetical Protein [Mycoplasmopsis fermentans M64]RMX35916.1 hypothetical protein MFI2_0237 [Mycoplasmopsis fermentans MF-I2]RMX36006.1 hypothetical protein MFI1_0230 [Mycoplasmopsis fermentans MF-I1]
MNSTREYFREAFTWKKLLHLFIILLISLIAGVSLYLYRTYKTEIPYKTNVSDTLLLIGAILLAYSIVIILVTLGFGTALFKNLRNNSLTRTKNELEAEKRKPASEEQRAKIKVLEKEIERKTRKIEASENKKINRFIYYLMLIIGSILLISSAIVGYM